jgi:hypothetical protein
MPSPAPSLPQARPTTPDPQAAARQAEVEALVREAAAWREAVARWQATVEGLWQAVEPARRALHDAWRGWVGALDEALLQPGWTKGERAQLQALLHEAATALLAVAPDAQASEALDRHAPGTARAARAAATPQPAPAPRDDTGAQTETETGIEEDWARAAAQAAEARAQRAAQRRADAAEKQRAQAAQAVTGSVREVYRRLASALHPDREPEPDLRARKTALMQQANQAYAAGDLQGLLALQREAGQLDAARHLPTDARQLASVVAELQAQVAQLRTQAHRLEAAFRAATGEPDGVGMQPHKAQRLVGAQVRRLREEVVLLQRQALLLRDPQRARDWLRRLR